MSLPKQVQQQAEAVEEIERQLHGEPESPKTDEAEEVAEGPAEEQPAPEPAETPAEEPVAETPEVTPPKDDTWERRYKTLDGKYKAEVPRLAAEVRELTSQLSAANARIDALLEATTKAQPDAPQKLVTDEDVETFGSDLVDLIDRKAREVAATMVTSEVADLKAENATLREQVGGVSERQTSNDRRAFYTDLGRLVPDYAEVNLDEGFIGWLSEVDPLSGFTRQDYLNNAFASFDVERTAALFDTYKQLTAPPEVPPSNQVLQRHVAPGTSKASTRTPPAAATKIWTSAEIDQFYRSVAKGKFQGSEAEQVRIEAEIDAAVAEGRIR
jgi:hypothetical protein